MRAGTLLLGLTLGTGCVSMKRYNALDQRFEKSQHRVDELQKELARRDALAKKRLEQLHELQADFKPLIDRGVLTVEVVDGRIVLAMAADVLFPSGSAALSDAGKADLREVGSLLSKKEDYEWQVEGHTDDDPINTPQFPNNWYLGAARAIEVVQFLVGAGMSPDSLSAASFGQYAPLASNNTPSGKAQNRRIELVLLPDLSELPGYQELMQQKGRPVRPQRPHHPPRPGGEPRQGN